jgi:alpha-D-xyloside xylohydrolase
MLARHRGSALLASMLFAMAACGGEGAAPKRSPAARTVDLGSGYVATLRDDGALEVTHDGALVVATAPGKPLASALHDPDQPDAFHDPEAIGMALSAIAGSSIQATSPAPGALRIVVPDQGADTALVSIAIAVDDGAYTGMGERFDHVDPRGAIVPMHLALDGTSESGTNEAHVPVPLLVSSRGYGMFVASREAGAFHVGADEPDVVRAVFEGRSLDVTFHFDPDPLAVVAAYSRATGLPRKPPRWALAPMHWRNEWADAATLLGDMNAIRAQRLPASCLWIDNPWQTSYNSAVLDPARFGDTAAMMKALADAGFRPLAWSTPYLERPSGAPENDAQTLYVEAKEKRFFVEDANGEPWPAPGCCHKGLGMIDFTNDAARAFWQGILKNATEAGFAGFKLDYGEDLVPDLLGARIGAVRSNGETERTGRSYPLGYHATYHAALDEARPDGFLLGRASSWGGQAEVDAIWPGDLDNDFSVHDAKNVGGLPAAIVAAQTLSASGFPSFGSDTGGYRGGMPSREALLRWAEHTAFSVVMQVGGGGDHHNPWLYDADAAAVYAKLARAHMQLVPYLEAITKGASTDGTPTIRPLTLAYPDDEAARPFADTEYLLGPDLLIAPIVTEGASARTVHFPPGRWVGYEDGGVHEGPSEATIDAPLGSPPVFLRAGALLPLYPDGIDTLVDATAPGIVTLAMRAGDVDAKGAVSGESRASWSEGSTLSVEEGPSDIAVSFRPKAPVESVVAQLRLATSALAASAKHSVMQNGSPVSEVPDEASVRACADTCYAETSGTVWIHARGDSDVRIANP